MPATNTTTNAARDLNATTTHTVHLMDAFPRKGWLAGEMIRTTAGREIRHTRLEAASYDRAAALAEAERRWPDATIVLPPVAAQRAEGRS
jgi:hypothetical protein